MYDSKLSSGDLSSSWAHQLAVIHKDYKDKKNMFQL